MASVVERGSFQFQAMNRRRGFPTKRKTFESECEALEWAKVAEAKMNRSTFVDTREVERTTLGEPLERYGRTDAGFMPRAVRLERLGRIDQAVDLGERALGV